MIFTFLFVQAEVLAAEQEPSALEIRRIVDGGPAAEGILIPRDAIRVFTYEGMAKDIEVDDQLITVDYGRTGCLFDRETGELMQRRTVVNGWLESESPKLPAWPEREGPTGPIGPGVVPPGMKEGETSATVVAASIEFHGETWSAIQPRWRLYENGSRMSPFHGWSEILEKLKGRSFVEAGRKSGRPRRHYTTIDGLAGTIVSGFAVFEDTLYAVCVDIYDPEKEAWGSGGLCRYSPARDRWTRVEIHGRPVRFVTMIETIGDELWIGFREGSGVEGDELFIGMGVHLREYRPEITAVSLARLKDGEWTVWSRPPYDPARGSVPPTNPSETPTERPVKVIPAGGAAFLFSDIRQWGTYRPGGHQEGLISRVDMKTGKWMTWDSEEVFGTRWVSELIEKNGELLVTSNRGVHQFGWENDTWRFLDPQPALKSPVFGPIQPVGEEVWFAYGNAPGMAPAEDGIIRYNERTGQWTRMSLSDLGSRYPPQKMILMPDGDLWVLFHGHPVTGVFTSIGAGTLTPWRSSTLGGFSDGEWECPVHLEGVPRSSGHSGWLSPAFQSANGPVTPSVTYRTKELILLGDRLYLCTGHEVFEGPDPWLQICSVPEAEEDRDRYHFPLTIAASEDGERLIITRQEEPHQQPETLSMAEYTPGDSEIVFETVPEKPASPALKEAGPAAKEPAGFRNNWASMSIREDEEWAIGPFEGERRVLETPWAVWLITGGELIRLDRAEIEGRLGSQDSRK